MSAKPALPLSKQIYYAIGQLGWSTLVNLIGLQLVYFYLPPTAAGIPIFITQAIFLVVLNAIVLIAASGRLFDAITDPIIASMSDHSRHPRGRRIPFMLYGAAPAALFCFLMFTPPVSGISAWNIVWLLVMQALFYLALTVYVTPFFALLPELSRNESDRLNLSTWISITYALGIVLASQTPAIAAALGGALGLDSVVRSLQLSFAIVCVLALVFMLVPVWTIDERIYSDSQPSDIPLLQALRQTFRNPHFLYYVVADFSYFTSIMIINTGLLYYVTVLLVQSEQLVSALLPVTVVVSFLFYPLVNVLARRVGKKVLVTASFFGMSLIFAVVYFLGDALPLPYVTQAYVVVLLYALPLAFLGVLPNAILADIATHDALATGEPKEGMYFAARTLAQKFGQTFGVLLFAALTTFGRDVGDDLGIRLSGVVGFVLCALAGVIFLRYQERRVLAEIKAMETLGVPASANNA